MPRILRCRKRMPVMKKLLAVRLTQPAQIAVEEALAATAVLAVRLTKITKAAPRTTTAKIAARPKLPARMTVAVRTKRQTSLPIPKRRSSRAKIASRNTKPVAVRAADAAQAGPAAQNTNRKFSSYQTSKSLINGKDTEPAWGTPCLCRVHVESLLVFRAMEISLPFRLRSDRGFVAAVCSGSTAQSAPSPEPCRARKPD